MPNDTAAPETPVKPKSRMLAVCENIQAMQPKFAAALPQHIPPEKFVRTVLNTLQLNPDIANECDAQSIYIECTKAAADGLIIDGREAALVKYNVKKKVDGVDRWVPAAKYMPMVAGLLKKARNSGEISSIVGRCVYQNDKFSVVFGDDEKLTHEPALDTDPGPLRLAYMVAKLRDGTIIRHVMTRKQIEKRRDASKSKDRGPWKDWEDDMWVKTVLRAGSKFLPSSSDRGEFDEIVTRDDDFYDLDGQPSGPPPEGDAQPGDQQQEQPRRRGRPPRQSTGGAGQKLNGAQPPDERGQEGAQGGPAPIDLVEWADPETGEVHMVTPAEKAAKEAEQSQRTEQQQTEGKPAETAQQPAQPQEQATQPRTQAQQPGLPLDTPDQGPIPGFLRRGATDQGASEEPPPPSDDDVI